jgi:ATP phosphoribosyltransferase
VNCMADLKALQREWGRPLRVATKFPLQAEAFFKQQGMSEVGFISAEGTLEIAPIIGYADLIADLVSTGTTLRDNRLKRLEDGEILASQGCLIANRASLKSNPIALGIARTLLEFIVAYLRARDNVSVFANMRGDSPEAIAGRMFDKKVIRGLQGPTMSPVITHQGEKWYAAHLVVRKDQLAQAIAELRSVGGSGVVVSPVSYIFEEEPAEYKNMLAQLED